VEKSLECAMCLNLLYQPTTLECGHSFCRRCIRSWLLSQNAICPLCRFPIGSAAVFLRVNYALASVCKLIFPTEMEKIAKEVQDLSHVPLLDKPPIPIFCGHIILTPGSEALWLLPDSFALLETLRRSFESQSNILYMDSNREATFSPGYSAPGCIAMECEISKFQSLNISNMFPGMQVENQYAVQMRSLARVKLTEVEDRSNESAKMRIYFGRGVRISDNIEEDLRTLQSMYYVAKTMLPLVLTNVLRTTEDGHDGLPIDPETLSLEGSSKLVDVLQMPRRAYQLLKQSTSTIWRLQVIMEMIGRIRIPELRRGTLLISERSEQDDAFGRSVVLITEHNDMRTIGVIINQDLDSLSLGGMYPPNSTDGLNGRDIALLYGGPVSLNDDQHGRMILSKTVPREVENVTMITDDVYVFPSPYKLHSRPVGLSFEEPGDMYSDDDRTDSVNLVSVDSQTSTSSTRNDSQVGEENRSQLDEMQEGDKEDPPPASAAIGERTCANELLLNGFAAWGPLQLEREIHEGGWYLTSFLANASIVFDTPRENLYERLVAVASRRMFCRADLLKWMENSTETAAR